jgi:HK97 family phage portal protein
MSLKAAWHALIGREVKASATWPLVAAITGGGAARFMDRRFERFAEEGYKKNVVAYRCISMLAQSAALLPWTVFRDESEVEDGELVRLVRRPNPWQGFANFVEAFIAFYLIAGDSFVEAVPAESGPPRELYTLRPDRMSITLDGQTGAPAAYLWKFGGRERRWAMDPVSGRGPILHWRSFNPLDPWNGQSPVDPAAFSIDQHNSAGEWNQRLLQNSAAPSGALVYAPKEGPAELSADQFARLKQSIDEQYRGARNAGRPLLLEGGLDWKAMGLSPKEMDWIRGKDVSAREIALAYGVPAQLVGIPDSQTYANMREARLALWEDTVVPLLDRAVDAFNVWIMQWWPDLQVRFDLDGVPALALRRERKIEGIERLVKAGIINRNEARDELGFGRMDGGDALLALPVEE